MANNHVTFAFQTLTLDKQPYQGSDQVKAGNDGGLVIIPTSSSLIYSQAISMPFLTFSIFNVYVVTLSAIIS